ncbi:thiol reductant ABC exporter subunit CydD [Leucobacter weissii]|uniref:Thiol reductant ABC exporter subunit CydD n=1 Tax=Leucobacter weissii TaxID=1983706 RepID=A0A939MKY8_9MICO|nr:thiol reductant ABC exporter subunit CydD [Leucobacter weissii]MBO1902898.1 thiol reductant ABC exporter subunit CydD [Leucobacter weissii]
MKPLDLRLLRYARSVRGVLGFGGLLGLLRTLAVIAWCWCLAQAITAIVLPVLGGMGGGSGRVGEGAPDVDALPWLLAGATAAMLARAAAGWGMDVLAARGAVRAKSQLRTAALDRLDARSPDWLAGRADAGPATALGRGLDALDGYFSAYLPQLILTVIATPILVLAVLLADPVSGVTVLIVFPVIPVFMILIGLATRSVQDRQWAQLQRLSGSFLDVVEGLSTLKIFRREQRQVERIERETGEYRTRTMRVLRVTFLSGFVLDLAGTFSIALVAVTIGTRLVAGEFPLGLGLFVLLLLPEAFMPIRAVGAAFHASTEGLAAAEDVFEIIEGEEDQPARVASGAPGGAPIGFDGVVVERGGRAVVGPVSFEVRPGEVVALAGPSGSGKSTLVSALLGFVAPSAGSLSRPETLAWTGQRAGLLRGTVAENVALGSDEPDPELVSRSLAAVGLPDLPAARALGVQGSGLSGGQAQRVAVARCLYRAWAADAGAVVLDEPSSALDAASEARVAEAMRAEARAGRAVLVVTHRQALLDAADRVVTVGAEEIDAIGAER